MGVLQLTQLKSQFRSKRGPNTHSHERARARTNDARTPVVSYLEHVHRFVKCARGESIRGRGAVLEHRVTEEGERVPACADCDVDNECGEARVARVSREQVPDPALGGECGVNNNRIFC